MIAKYVITVFPILFAAGFEPYYRYVKNKKK